MKSVFFAISLASIVVSSGAMAQQRSGTPEEQKACTRDVERFCRSVMDQGDFTVLACLKDHREKISKPCDGVLKAHGQ